MNFIKARLSEPSTWAGLGLMIVSLAQAWQSKDPTMIAGAIGGIIAAVKADRVSIQPKQE